MLLDKKSSEDRAYAEIMAMILSQEIPPGSVMMEGALAERLKMSRTPIRAALRRLVSSGLLDITSNRSASVPILSKKDWDDLFELRLRIEPRIASLAAMKFGPEKGSFLRELVEEEKKEHHDDSLSLQEINERLHLGIAELADNKYMFMSLNQVFWRCQLYVCFFDSFLPAAKERVVDRFEKPYELTSIAQHERIVDAITSRNAEQAEDVMREHIMSTYQRSTSYTS